MVDYIVDLVRATRDPAAWARGSQAAHRVRRLAAGVDRAGPGGAGARLSSRAAYVVPEDVRALAPDVLRHRIVLTFEAEAEDIDDATIVGDARCSARVRVP